MRYELFYTALPENRFELRFVMVWELFLMRLDLGVKSFADVLTLIMNIC